MKWWLLWLAAFALGACSGAGGESDAGFDAGTDAGTDAGADMGADDFVDPRPEPICNRGFPSMFEALVDRTEETGLSESGIDARAFRLMGADLDGDGYVDLVAVAAGAYERGLQRVYMNVPHPGEAGRRVFEEATGTGIDLNRDPEAEGRFAPFHVAGDVDNDGDMDLFAGAYVSNQPDLGDRQEILLNDGSGHFSLVPGTSSVATEAPPANSHAVFFDYDRDGVLDLYVGNWYENYPVIEALQDDLYRGNGDGTFALVTEEAGLGQLSSFGGHNNRKPTYGLTHCDVDGDGDQDILQAAYGRQWNDLFLNNGDGTFTNIGESSDFDGDELVDYTDNEFYRCACRADPDCTPDRPPAVDCSARGWSVTDTMPFRLNGNTFGVECADVDRDLDMDVFLVDLAHSWAGSSSDRSQLLVNNGETGTELAFTRPGLEATDIHRDYGSMFWDEGDVNAGFLDFDNDGYLDLVIASGAYTGGILYLYRQLPDGTFREMNTAVGIEVGRPAALLLADYDRDGDTDIFTGSTSSRVTLLENQAGEIANWTRIVLEGQGPPDGANRPAIGARVTVSSGDLTQVQEVQSGTGHYGRQDELALGFGFNDRCEDLTIEVRWPNRDLTVQRFEGVRANYEIRIVEGADEVEYVTP